MESLGPLDSYLEVAVAVARKAGAKVLAAFHTSNADKGACNDGEDEHKG